MTNTAPAVHGIVPERRVETRTVPAPLKDDSSTVEVEVSITACGLLWGMTTHVTESNALVTCGDCKAALA